MSGICLFHLSIPPMLRVGHGPIYFLLAIYLATYCVEGIDYWFLKNNLFLNLSHHALCVHKHKQLGVKL